MQFVCVYLKKIYLNILSLKIVMYGYFFMPVNVPTKQYNYILHEQKQLGNTQKN